MNVNGVIRNGIVAMLSGGGVTGFADAVAMGGI